MSSELSDTKSLAARARTVSGMTWLFVALGAPFALFLLLEGGLRLFGVGYNADFFIRDEPPGIYRTNPRFADPYFVGAVSAKPQNFRLPKKKPAGALRIFVLGESAAAGLPEPGFGLTAQLRAQLRSAYPEKDIECYNLGVAGVDSHLIRLIARQAAEFSPDVFVLYFGHNEVVGPFGPGASASGHILPLWWIRTRIWFDATRSGQLLRRLADRVLPGGSVDRDWRSLELPVGTPIAADDARLIRVQQYFSANLLAVLATAQAARAKVVLATMAVNTNECAPFASLHRTDLSSPELAAWHRAVDDAIDATELGQVTVARQRLERALQIDPDHAETHFRLGQLLATLGDAGAQREFDEALRCDALHFRAGTAINDALRQAAQSFPQFVSLVATAEAIRALRPPTTPAFFDHVHLTWEGNFIVARQIAPVVATALFGQPPTVDRWLGSDSCASRVGYTDAGRLAMVTQMDAAMALPPYTNQFNFAANRTRSQRALAQASQALNTSDALRSALISIETALEDDPRNAFLLYHAAGLNAQLNATQHALELNARLAALRPKSAADLDQRAYLLISAGQLSDAEAMLLDAVQLDATNVDTYALLAQLWLMDRQSGKARTYFAGLVARNPDHVGLRLVYADILSASGEWTAADAQWMAVLERAPANEAALKPVVQRLVERHETDAAIALMLKAQAANSRDFPNNERLLQLYGQRGDRAKVVEYMQALADSGPVAPSLHADLGDLLFELGRNHEALIEYVRARRAAEADGDTAVAKRATDAIREHQLDHA